MDIKCNINNNYLTRSQLPSGKQGAVFRGKPRDLQYNADACVTDIYLTERPVVPECATGLSGLKGKFYQACNSVMDYFRNYKKNIKHTYEHKIVFALIEKELFGKNSLDSVTHDLDKMLLYLVGAPKSFVSRYHRSHSVHHTESGKNMNLRSMLCDNIASSPEFKPEKKRSLREHFQKSQELQNVPGLKEVLEKFNYGENIDFNKIKFLKVKKASGLKGMSYATLKSLVLVLLH